MISKFKILFLLSITFCVSALNCVASPLAAYAGNPHQICPGDTVFNIGGNPAATGGQPPYHYSWSPSAGLNNSTIGNPYAFPSSNTTYTLTVTDDTGAVASSSVYIFFNYIYSVYAGNNISVCKNSGNVIGGIYNFAGQGVSYSWSPSAGLNDSTLPRPFAAPTQTTLYTLTATQAGCHKKISSMLVKVIVVAVDAGQDTTMQEGQTITLHASGFGTQFYNWTPTNTLTYANTANPDAEPIVTTTYYVTAWDPTYQCACNDSMIVNVNRDNGVYFYNTFTPNGDGNNDTWYIGNIYKYPNNYLEIYNRNGQLVFKKDGYNNDWNGRALGLDLPSGTYFYIMDLGDGTDKYHGTVTIIR